MEQHELLEEIRVNIRSTLKKARLADAINYGDHTTVDKLRPPVIWVLPSDSPIDHSGMGEMWTYRFTLAVVVKDTDPDRGFLKANEIAGKASAALVKTRTLDKTVRDVRRVTYLPGPVRGMTAKQLHAAGYMMEVRFRYLERED